MTHDEKMRMCIVVSKKQNKDWQRIAMLDFGVPSKNIYMDKQSGKDFQRPGYQSVKRLYYLTISEESDSVAEKAYLQKTCMPLSYTMESGIFELHN